MSKRDAVQTQEGHHLDINICCLAQRALLQRPQACLWPVLSDHPCQSSSQDNKKSVDGYSPSFGGVPKDSCTTCNLLNMLSRLLGAGKTGKHRQTYCGVSKTMLLLWAVLKLRSLHELCSQCKQLPQVQEMVWCGIGAIGVHLHAGLP